MVLQDSPRYILIDSMVLKGKLLFDYIVCGSNACSSQLSRLIAFLHNGSGKISKVAFESSSSNALTQIRRGFFSNFPKPAPEPNKFSSLIHFAAHGEHVKSNLWSFASSQRSFYLKATPRHDRYANLFFHISDQLSARVSSSMRKRKKRE